MKKSPSIIIAQGTVVFNNGNGGLVRQFNNQDYTLSPVPKGGGQVELYWAATGTAYTPWTAQLSPRDWYAANPGWTLGPLIGFTTPTAGKFTGGAITLTPLAPGGTIDYVVIGWTGNQQSMDAALAYNALVAVSAKFTSATGNPTAIPPGTAVPLADTFGGLDLAPVPEPSSFALAVLGVATLLGLRRRK